jgi:hypothetical protein
MQNSSRQGQIFFQVFLVCFEFAERFFFFFFFSFFGELLLCLVISASESENRRIFELALMLKSINLDHCCLKSLFEEMSFLVLWNCYLTIYHVFFCCLICFAFHTFHVNGNFSYLAL